MTAHFLYKFPKFKLLLINRKCHIAPAKLKVPAICPQCILVIFVFINNIKVAYDKLHHFKLICSELPTHIFTGQK